MKLNKNLLFILSVSLLLVTQTAHADFRKALDAYIARDGDTMLKEVKDAVDKKNDDGLILYLSILKQYPKTWQSTLDSSQQVELFNYLEKATMQSSLQAQYRLALISRLIDYPKPNSPEAAQEELALIQRLEPVANKGYAPAAYHLYGHRSPKSKGDQANAIKWLIKAAELGSTEAAFKLGMKYLNVVDDYYGCVSYEPNLCLPKDAAKGWYWMQQAAVQANERNIRLGDFAYEMGNLYRYGIAGNKPDLEQAYLWYLLGLDKPSQLATSGYGVSESLNYKINKKIKELKELANAENITLSKNTIYQQSFKKQKDFPKPLFSMYVANGSAKLMDIYGDGKVSFVFEKLPTDTENIEMSWKIKPEKIKSFQNQLLAAGFSSADASNYEPFTDQPTIKSIHLLSLHNNKSEKSIFRYGTKNYELPFDKALVNYLAILENHFSLQKLDCVPIMDKELQSRCFNYYQQLKK